ncbi:MAG: UDP-3-O-acyl-N-acetylglucosamine deacetylase [bacterium]
MRQQSIEKSFTLQGIGLHSGKPCKVVVSPAKESSGIVLNNAPAIAAQVGKTNRGTTVAGVAVTEHFLAAAYGLAIDNLMVQVEGGEFPALDGSALAYVQALQKAKIIEQASEKKVLKVKSPLKVNEGERALEALPYNGFKVCFMVDFPGIGEQKLEFDLEKNDFAAEIAPARTVGYLKEREALKSQGLGLGASLENALVIGDKGYLNKPRFKDEIVRHKILDLIGDLALLGRPIKAEIRARKSGHRLNIELARRILDNG